MSDFIDLSPKDVFTWFKRPKSAPEINSGEEVVEKEGYIPADVQIKLMLQAGVRLGEYRREMYDYADEDEVPEDAIDPRSFTDPVDAQRALNQVKSRLEAQAEKVKAEEAAQATAAEESENGAS